MKRQDVTAVLQRYLEAKRHLWNAYFREEVGNLEECGALDDYEQIDRNLFQALVLRKLDLPLLEEGLVLGVDPVPAIFVTSVAGVEHLPALVSGPPPERVGQWRQATADLSQEHSIQFIEFFDWDRYTAPSYPLVLGRIELLYAAQELKGHNVLLDAFRLRFLLSS